MEGCFSTAFEFYSGEAKKLEIQVDTKSSHDGCVKPMGIVLPIAAASRVIQDLTITAKVKLGENGNLLQFEYVTGGTAGSEVVSFSGTSLYVGNKKFLKPKVTVQIQPGVSTAAQIKAALDASDLSGVIDVAVSGVGSNPQIVQALVPLQNGTGSFVEVELQTNDENLIFDVSTTPPVVVVDDRFSQISIELTSDETNQMVSGAIVTRVVKAGKLRIAAAPNGVSQITTPNC